MQHTTGSFLTRDGLHLLTRTWLPDVPPKAAILLVHGINEHSGRYAYMAAHMMAHGIAVYSYDQRGHGQSEGPQVYIEAFEEYCGDLALMMQQVLSDTEGVPLFLMGHSLGGLVTSLFIVTQHPKLHALILSSPALQIPADLSPVKQKLLGLVNRFAPKLVMGKFDIEYISRDKAVQEAYLSDPLIHSGGINARMGFEVLEATEKIRMHPEAFRAPLYLIHGTDDHITDPNGSKWLYAEAPSADKTLRLYEGLRHETMNEPERDTVLSELSTWILKRA